jgi:hypothetical protein
MPAAAGTAAVGVSGYPLPVASIGADSILCVAYIANDVCFYTRERDGHLNKKS